MSRRSSQPATVCEGDSQPGANTPAAEAVHVDLSGYEALNVTSPETRNYPDIAMHRYTLQETEGGHDYSTT